MENFEEYVDSEEFEEEEKSIYILLELQNIVIKVLCRLEFWVFVVTVTVALGWYFYRINNHLKEFPSPPQIPFLGHLLDYMDETLILPIISNRLFQYGGVIRQSIGPLKPSLSTANREFMQWVYQHSKYITKAKYYTYLKPWLGEGLLTIGDGIKWKKRRRALGPCFFQTSILKSFLETFETKSDILVDVLSKLENEEINVHILTKRFTLDVLLATAMGAEMDVQRNETSSYFKSVEILCRVYVSRMRNFFKMFDIFYRFTADYTAEKSALKVINQLFEDTLNKKLAEKGRHSEDNHKVDMLELLMNIKVDGKPLTNEEIREEINTFAFAGYDTTAACMALTLYEIAANPKIQEKLFEEQKAIFKTNLKNPDTSYEIFSEMTYLDLVLKESLRLYAIVPAVGKKIKEDVKYGDTTLPERLNFAVVTYALHTHPDYWDEPDKFIPERFEDKKLLDPTIYVPFGVKPRECIGQRFALLELKSTISKIIRNFELIKIPAHQLILISNLTLQSKTGIFIKFKRRE